MDKSYYDDSRGKWWKWFLPLYYMFLILIIVVVIIINDGNIKQSFDFLFLQNISIYGYLITGVFFHFMVWRRNKEKVKK